MIELNKQYSMKTLSENLNISYGTFRNNRKLYEEHLAKFYLYSIEQKGNGTYYTFIEEINPYIPYKEYKQMTKSKTVQKLVKKVIEEDNRQTGSNIARIIIVNGEIQALGWQQSTLTVYVRDELKRLIEEHFYIKEDYRWCYLDKEENKYVLMSDGEVKELRSYFKSTKALEQEESIWAEMKEGNLSLNEAKQRVGELRLGGFIQGCKKFMDIYGNYPIKVPVYVRVAF